MENYMEIKQQEIERHKRIQMLSCKPYGELTEDEAEELEDYYDEQMRNTFTIVGER